MGDFEIRLGVLVILFAFATSLVHNDGPGNKTVPRFNRSPQQLPVCFSPYISFLLFTYLIYPTFLPHLLLHRTRPRTSTVGVIKNIIFLRNVLS